MIEGGEDFLNLGAAGWGKAISMFTYISFVPAEQLVGSKIRSCGKCSIGTPCPMKLYQNMRKVLNIEEEDSSCHQNSAFVQGVPMEHNIEYGFGYLQIVPTGT